VVRCLQNNLPYIQYLRTDLLRTHSTNSLRLCTVRRVHVPTDRPTDTERVWIVTHQQTINQSPPATAGPFPLRRYYFQVIYGERLLYCPFSCPFLARVSPLEKARRVQEQEQERSAPLRSRSLDWHLGKPSSFHISHKATSNKLFKDLRARRESLTEIRALLASNVKGINAGPTTLLILT
jgi:hypothetical protein